MYGCLGIAKRCSWSKCHIVSANSCCGFPEVLLAPVIVFFNFEIMRGDDHGASALSWALVCYVQQGFR